MSENSEEMQALLDSYDHWIEMIAYAMTQHPDDTPNGIQMDAAIDQSWRAASCALCELYNRKLNRHCLGCPLVPHCDSTYDSEGNLKHSLWYFVDTATTWDEWIDAAYDMLHELQRLADERKELECTSCKSQSTSQS